jgi:voltage-gated potassium channel
VRRLSLHWALPSAAIVVLLAGGGFAAVEADTVTTYWRGVWWALSLMTTVGFVSGSPSTGAGQALAAVLMVLGFLLFALTTATIASAFVTEDDASQHMREDAFAREALAELRGLADRLDRLERRQSAGQRDGGVHQRAATGGALDL